MNPQITGSGALLATAWKAYKAHWKILVPIAILPTVGSYIGQLMATTHQLVPAMIGGLVTLIAAVFSIAMGPALVSAVHRLTAEPGVKLSVNPQYRIGFGFFWSVILIAIINGLVFFGSFFLLVVPAIIVGVYGCLYVFTLVVDGKRGFSALTESYSLVYGRWAAVFGRLIVLGLAALAVWLVMAGITFIIGHAFGFQVPIGESAGGTLPAGFLTMNFIANLVGLSLILPIGALYMYGLYSSLKATREANVETGVFKKWLIAFICVGAFAIIASLLAIPALVFIKAQHALRQESASMQLNIQKMQRIIPASSTLPVRPE